ncbi:MAG: hypothetical protein KAT25_06185 [Sulfuriflexus sp.]|nr:hypothetical protein [Sulfuriflexus sp.]
MDSSKVNQCIEALCSNGCEAVRATISNLESGVELEQLHDLEKNEITTVLNELKSIMSVYDKPR